MAATVRARALITLAISIPLALAGCRWREGRSVLLPDTGPTIRDADTETADSDVEADADADAECADAPEPIEPELLQVAMDEASVDIDVYDVRPREMWEAGHIPGAQCDPWGGTALDSPIALPDEPGWLVLYDSNGEAIQDALRAVPRYCSKTVKYLELGFGAWAENPQLPIEEGAP